jgi:hypothetical protein
MRNVCTLLCGLMLSVCLSLYGPSGMAKASEGVEFSMVICADGVAKTVVFDADGNPVEPAQNCPECLRCCQVIGALDAGISSGTPSCSQLAIGVDCPLAQNPILNKRNIFPAPRGPPAVRFSMLNMPRPTKAVRFVISQITRSDGRPMLKDATA